MAFATGSQLCQQYDRRDIADLCAESETSTPSPANIESNPIVAAALDRASGIIVSHAVIADKYDESDLEQLARDGDPFLAGLTCAIAMGELLGRRSMQSNEPPAIVRKTDGWLERLSKGDAIFNVSANRNAGNMHLSNPSVVTLENAGFASAIAENRFFPARPHDY